jgi:HEAT repeat protein
VFFLTVTAAAAVIAWLGYLWLVRPQIPSTASPEVRGLIEKTFSFYVAERAEAAKALGKLGPEANPAIPFLIRLWCRENTVASGAAGYALRALGKPTVEPLIAELGNQRGPRRGQVVAALKWIRDRRAIPAVIAVLDDPDPKIRGCAARFLLSLPDARAKEPLLQRVLDPKEQDNIVVTAAAALGKIGGDSRAVEPLLAIIERHSGTRSGWARRALGANGDGRAFELLLATVREARDQRPNAPFSPREAGKQAEAIEAIGCTKEPRAFELLCQILDDNKLRPRPTWGPSPRLKPGYPPDLLVAAVAGLEAYGDAKCVGKLESIMRAGRQAKWLDQQEYPAALLRHHAARALIRTGDPGAIDVVISEFKTHQDVYDGVFRLSVVNGLALSPEPRAYLHLIELLTGNDQRISRRAAKTLATSIDFDEMSEDRLMGALPALDDDRVLEALMKVAGNPKEAQEIRKDARRALRKSDRPKVWEFLKKLDREGGIEPDGEKRAEEEEDY